MPTIKVELNAESFRRLTEIAVAERRPIPWQAEVLLLRALAVPGESIAQEAQLQPHEELCGAAMQGIKLDEPRFPRCTDVLDG